MKKQQLYKFFKIKPNILDEILCKELCVSKERLFLLDEIDDKYLNNIKKFVKKFQNWVPLEYILEKANFYSLDFFVDKRVLIPRNDTEIIVKKVLKESKNFDEIVLIDVWTGSSNIAISCLVNSPNFKNCFVIDKSKKALKVSKINIEKYGLQDKIIQLKWSLLKPFLWLLIKKISTNQTIGNWFITANLPYIKNKDYKNMSPETLKYEPKTALFWWKKTGFELYEKLIKQILQFNSSFINKDNRFGIRNTAITIFLEIGFDQYEYSKKYLENLWLKYEYFKDNSWFYRCVKMVI